MSDPVSTKPLRSRAISGGSQPVCASAPMKMKSPPESRRSVAPVSRSRTSMASSEVSPCAAATSTPPRQPMFRLEAIWSTR